MKPRPRIPERREDHVVVVLGASPKPARYSNQAVRLLDETGYRVIPVHPRVETIEGIPVAARLALIEDAVHTLTLYVGEARSTPLIPEILALNPARVIFNPGSESAGLEQQLRAHHVEVIHGCTLVMVRINQF